MKFIVFVFSILFINNSYGQCCAQSSPMGGSSNQGVLKKGTARISAFYTHSQSIKQDLDANYYLILDANFNFVGTNISYGITDKLTLETELGYFLNKTQNYDLQPIYTLTGFGLTNGVVSLKRMLIKDTKRNFEVTFGIGAKFPFNTEYQMVDGVQLPIDNQPSTCAYGIAPKILIFKKFVKQKVGLFLIHKYDKNFKNKQGYEYGSGFITALFMSKSLDFISCSTFGVLQIRNSYRLSDKKVDGEIAETTGSNLLFIAPQIGHTFAKKYSLSVSYELPIYQEYNTTKLKNKNAFSVNLIADIGGKEKECDLPIGEGYTEKTIKVYGNCSMCKEKIESTLKKQKGVKGAIWDIESKQLKVMFDEAIITLEEIKQKLADVGYDTDSHRAKDKAYNKLHGCCQYDRP